MQAREHKEHMAIRTENLSFLDMIYYPDIAIPHGQITFVRGESGSGKSTLFKLFAALERPSGGAIYYDGKSIEDLDTVFLRREVMLVPQSFYLFDGTIKDNFNEYYKYRQEEIIDDELIKHYLELCMINHTLDSDTVSMSGGERQRVFVALCLSLLPKIIMLDEPTSALDAETANKMFANIKSFCGEHDMTLLAISHDDKLSSKFAKQVIRLPERSSI
jgi:putative ABC transport system ATP-binding protein